MSGWQSSGWRWLESTVDLQRDYFGVNFQVLAGDPAAQAREIFWRVFAALVELGEVSREFTWKHWASDEPYVNRGRVIEELVDVAHFVAGILVVMGVTDDEWEAAYQAKQEENRERQRRGYWAKKG